MANGARAKKELRKLSHGWFVTPHREGDRTVDQQMLGLEHLALEITNKTILDVGCAEGLIGIELVRAGAKSSFGFDYFDGHLEIAQELSGDLPCTFAREDANEFTPEATFDVVLMLAVLHKLRNPSEACQRFARLADDLCVIRLSPSGSQVITDGRSNNVPFDIGAVMMDEGFKVERQERGPFGEMTFYYRRYR